MISSRWPRPIGIIASMALIRSAPACRPFLRGDDARRDALDGAGVASSSIGPLSSSGWPSASTTRPMSASPTGTSAMRPVVLTLSPSWMRVVAEDDRADRLLLQVEGHAHRSPLGNSSSSDASGVRQAVDAGDAVADLDDVPTLAGLVDRVELVDRGLDDLVISSERMAMQSRESALEGARGELVPQSLQAAPDAAVDDAVADPDDRRRRGVRVDVHDGSKRPPVTAPSRPGSAQLGVSERRGAGDRGADDALLALSSPRNSAATCGSSSIRPRRSSSRTRLSAFSDDRDRAIARPPWRGSRRRRPDWPACPHPRVGARRARPRSRSRSHSSSVPSRSAISNAASAYRRARAGGHQRSSRISCSPRRRWPARR